ncbi:hypothetical protein BKA70DRAFT_1238316 [Coprinopsis sp. MPI-PUGE-AT-0042]|nr:hypothetical protein BKA70DRAFT_1238316 [Coprinopsis sp. MPI-PUGE-AT-0042]
MYRSDSSKIRRSTTLDTCQREGTSGPGEVVQPSLRDVYRNELHRMLKGFSLDPRRCVYSSNTENHPSGWPDPNGYSLSLMHGAYGAYGAGWAVVLSPSYCYHGGLCYNRSAWQDAAFNRTFHAFLLFTFEFKNPANQESYSRQPAFNPWAFIDLKLRNEASTTLSSTETPGGLHTCMSSGLGSVTTGVWSICLPAYYPADIPQISITDGLSLRP